MTSASSSKGEGKHSSLDDVKHVKQTSQMIAKHLDSNHIQISGSNLIHKNSATSDCMTVL